MSASDVRTALPRRAAQVTTALLRRLVVETLKAVPRDVSEDAVIDQRSGLVPPDLYLRLANAGVFPSRKLGKRTLARWGDVRAALLPAAEMPKEPVPPPRKTSPDDLRMRWGLAPTGRK